MRQRFAVSRHAAMLMLCLMLPAPVMAVDQAVLDEEAGRIELVRDISPAVVAIFAPGGSGGGSGVVISPDGYTLTNFHVVAGLGPFMKCGMPDGELYDAVIVGIDPTGDVALIKLLGRDDFPTATLGDSDMVQVGQGALAMGNPFLLANDFTPTVTYGIVSGVHRYQYPSGTFIEYTDCIQVDASINPGNSGGPLFAENGHLIGINGRISFEKRSRVNSGVGYAISINQIKHFLDHLKSGRVVDHATLGATVRADSEGRIVVNDILEESDAYRRGLRSGDEIVRFAGRPIGSVNQFKNILGIYPKGWKLPIVYRRDGERHEIVVRLRALHRAAELTPNRPIIPPPQRPPEDPEEEERPGRPPLMPHGPAPAPKPPEEFKHLYEQKQGFANWYFNRLHRDELHAALLPGSPLPGEGTWFLNGSTDAGLDAEIRIGDEAVGMRIGESTYVWQTEEPPGDVPPGTGGFLAAVVQYRHLLTDPEDYFTEYYYLGSEPFAEDRKVHVLITTRGSVESRWYVDYDTGALLGFDVTLEPDAEPCEVRFPQSDPAEPLPVAGQWTVRHGEQDVLSLTIESATTK